MTPEVQKAVAERLGVESLNVNGHLFLAILSNLSKRGYEYKIERVWPRKFVTASMWNYNLYMTNHHHAQAVEPLDALAEAYARIPA